MNNNFLDVLDVDGMGFLLLYLLILELGLDELHDLVFISLYLAQRRVPKPAGFNALGPLEHRRVSSPIIAKRASCEHIRIAL